MPAMRRPPTAADSALACALAIVAALATLSSCGGDHASRRASPPIAPLLPALPPEAARPIALPTLRCSAFDGRTTAELDRAVAGRARIVERCHRASVAAGMPVRGAVAVDLAIAEDGEVLGVTVRDTDPSLDRIGACVSDALRGERLPAPANGCVRVAWAVSVGPALRAPSPVAPLLPGAITW